MGLPKYRSFADFEREEIRPDMRAGWTLDDIADPAHEIVDFDFDPFEAAIDAADEEGIDDED